MERQAAGELEGWRKDLESGGTGQRSKRAEGLEEGTWKDGQESLRDRGRDLEG